MTVVPNGQMSKTRGLIMLRGLGPSHTIGVYNNDIRTVVRAFKERYFKCKTPEGFELPVSVRPRTFKNDRHLQEFRLGVVSRCVGAPVVPTIQVVGAYSGLKRRIYENAYQSLFQTKLSKRDARLTSFVKFEKQDLRKAPRVINPRSARFNLELGKYLKFLEKRVYSAITEQFGSVADHVVIKGLNVCDSAMVLRTKWQRFRDPVAVGLDATKFDMHVSVEALKFEHSFYTGIFPHSAELREILRWQLDNRGTAYCLDGKVKFKMSGTRSSGDLNTSLGNCLLMCSMVYAHANASGVVVELCNNGDDCVVIMERESLSRFLFGLTERFMRYGFRMEVEEPVFEFEQIEFCQSKPVWTEQGYTMVRRIDACFKKDPLCLIPVPNVNVLRKWRKAVGDCGYAITKGVPVMQNWYRVFQRGGADYSDGFLSELVKNTSARERMKGLPEQEVVVSGKARASFYYAFGMNPDEQIALEKWFDNVEIEDELHSCLDLDTPFDKFDNVCHGLVTAVCA
jgi:hypothetical protein